jgi:hypothetical protein
MADTGTGAETTGTTTTVLERRIDMALSKLFTALLVALVVAALLAVPAGAQGYTGWVEHPYPSVDYFWCEYFGADYYCWSPINEQWFPANPDWYNQAYAEMMRLYGQGVL